IEFTCQKCEASFELDAQDLIDGAEKLACPHCEAKCPANLAEDFISALTEMRAQVGTLGKKFGVSFTVDSEDIADEIASKDEDEDEDEADDDEDLEDDADEDDDDLDDDDDDDDDLDDDEEELDDEDASDR
ncbi:MAG: hypothetical protein ACT4TC_08205, partial [Myxococcaceae bacterium]